MANTECPEDFIEWLGNMKLLALDGANELFVEVASYIHKVSMVCCKIRHVMYDEHPELCISTALDLLVEAGCVDSSCKIAADLLKGDQTAKAGEGVFSTLYTLNLYRTARCKMFHFLTLMLNHVLPFVDSESDQLSFPQWNLDCQIIVQDMITDILEIAPFGTQPAVDNLPSLSGQRIQCWADALRLIWPLTVITWLVEALPEQRNIANESLRQIGKNLGIKQAWIEGTSTRPLLNIPHRL